MEAVQYENAWTITKFACSLLVHFFHLFSDFFFTCLTFFFSHGLKSRYNGIKSVISGRDGCESTFFCFTVLFALSLNDSLALFTPGAT